MNKTGKWRSCQNPSQTPLKVAYPGAQQTQCRHERCIDCMPKGFALHPGAEHIAVRRWPPDGLTEDDKTVQNDICAQMAMALMIRDVGLECKAKKDEGKTKRDPLSGLRIGEWPGGF